MTLGGGLVGSLAPSAISAQRHIRQFEFLRDDQPRSCSLAGWFIAKLQGQLRFLLRATRGSARANVVESSLHRIRKAVSAAAPRAGADVLLGAEGSGAAAYFEALPDLMTADLDERLTPATRTRRPPQDRFSALLGYGYGMLYRAVLQALIAVGLHPGFGFYHRPRSNAQTLALDMMELFRVPIVDMAIVAALNRHTFDADAHFIEQPGKSCSLKTAVARSSRSSNGASPTPGGTASSVFAELLAHGRARSPPVGERVDRRRRLVRSLPHSLIAS